jgi:hypothetical protein
MHVVKFDRFVLSSNLSRTVNGGVGGGRAMCIVAKDYMQIKEVNYITELGSNKKFEVSALEILNLNTIIVCMYRSPEGGFYEFLAKMEMIIDRVQLQKKQLVLCGDWNVNFLKSNTDYCIYLMC